jgi:predicted NBD/HSP70 family sugar kinase
VLYWQKQINPAIEVIRYQPTSTSLRMSQALYSGRNALTVKAHNVRTLLLTLLRQQPISRVRLARETRLSTTTVTNLIAELIEQGIVVEAGTDVAGMRPGAGRPPLALRLRPASRHALGIHIGVRQVRVALVDLQANVTEHQHINVVRNESGESVIGRTAAVCRDLINMHHTTGNGGAIVGIGVGASGLVRSRTGVNVLSPNLGWHDVPLRDLLTEQVGLPVVVDNNVRCMALAESLYGVGRNVRALAYVYARVGVGAGLVVDGELYHGADYGAGEIGHWVMRPEGGALCRCGNHGCLETEISENVLLALAEQIQPELTRGRSDPLSVIFDGARDGHLALVEMLETRAYFLGLALANLVNVLNPEMIMLGGWLAEAFDLIAPVAESTMRRHAFGGIGDAVDVLPTTFGVQSGVIGAGVLALETFVFTP